MHEALQQRHSKQQVDTLAVVALLLICVICFLGSLTFLVGSTFPAALATFAGLYYDPDTAHTVGTFMGVSNVLCECFFYCYTFTGLLHVMRGPLDSHLSARQCGLLLLAAGSALPLTLVSIDTPQVHD